MILRADLNCEQVQLSKLFLEVAQEVRTSVEDMMISAEAEGNMSIFCDPELMRLAIKSLCMSVVEYCKPHRQAAICMGTSNPEGGKQTFYIRNISGDSYLEDHNISFKLFGLHSKTKQLPESYQYLSLAESVVNRHGGHIWAENTKDAGTTIFFTI